MGNRIGDDNGETPAHRVGSATGALRQREQEDDLDADDIDDSTTNKFAPARSSQRSTT